MEIVSLKEARSKGLLRYFTGKPCKRGHLSERGTASRGCIQCSLSWEAKWRSENPEKARNKDSRRHSKNAEQEIIYRKQRRLKNGDALRAKERENTAKNKDKYREKWRRFREKHREILLARNRAQYAVDKTGQVKRVRNWQKSHPEEMRVAWRNKHARKKNAIGKHSKEDIIDIIKLQRGCCAYCRRKLTSKYHVDHIIALVNGGSNDRRNLQALCAACNCSKNKKDPIQYSRSLGMLI